MAEIWELVNLKKEKTGHLYVRGSGDLMPAESYHLFAAIWVRNEKGQLLLTQRNPAKDCGLLWECTGGCVVKGEDCRTAACRELAEEIGIKADPEDLIYLGDTVGQTFIAENYLLCVDSAAIRVRFADGEVVGVMWVPHNQMKDQKHIMVPAVWNRYLQFEEQIFAGGNDASSNR